MGLPKVFARNAEIYGEGESADSLYKVLCGAIRTCRSLADGRRQIGAFYLPGDTFGLESMGQHVFSAEAVVETTILIINRSEVSSLAEWDKEVARTLWALMSRELQRSQDHAYLLIKTAPERLASFLLEMDERILSDNELELPMLRQDIADYLGLTIETVSRTLTQLENESAIALPTCKRIVLNNRAVLKRLID